MVEIKDPLSQPMANPFAEDDVLKDFVPPRVQTADVRKYFYKGKEYQGSSSMIGALSDYLNQRGQRQLLNVDTGLAQASCPLTVALADSSACCACINSF